MFRTEINLNFAYYGNKKIVKYKNTVYIINSLVFHLRFIIYMITIIIIIFMQPTTFRHFYSWSHSNYIMSILCLNVTYLLVLKTHVKNIFNSHKLHTPWHTAVTQNYILIFLIKNKTEHYNYNLKLKLICFEVLNT